VCALCRFAVFARGGSPLVDVPGADVIRLQTPVPGITATEIRRRVHQGLSLEGLTPPDVIDYIGAKRLYDPPIRMTRKAARKRLKADLPEPRFRHVLAVEETVAVLAERFGFPVKRARMAALLHDCAKGLTLQQMQKTVDACGVHVDSMRRTSRELLHAPASAAQARRIYGVTDPEILRAIWHHNTCTPQAGLLDKLLCVADMIEPGRKTDESLAAVRRLAEMDLDAAYSAMLKRKLAIVSLGGKAPHPDTAAAMAANQNCVEQQRDKEETV